MISAGERAGRPLGATSREDQDRTTGGPDGDAPREKYALEDIAAVALLWALLIAVFLQFFTRYVLNASLGWTEEVARYLLVLLGFVGSIAAFRRASHVRIDAFVSILPPKPRMLLNLLARSVTAGLLLWCVWLAAEVTSLVRFQRLASVDVPLSWLYAVVAISFAAMAARLLVPLVRDIVRLVGRTKMPR